MTMPTTMTTPTTLHFNPLDHGFRWVDGWYIYDRIGAETKARETRENAARQYKHEGYKVRKGRLTKQLITQGGIGTGRPQIDLVVTIFTLTIS